MSESTVFNDFYVFGDRENLLTASFTSERRVVPERAQLISVIVGVYVAGLPSAAAYDMDIRKQGVTTGMPTFEIPIAMDTGDWAEVFAVTPVTFLENEHINATVTGGDPQNINYSWIYRFRRN